MEYDEQVTANEDFLQEKFKQLLEYCQRRIEYSRKGENTESSFVYQNAYYDIVCWIDLFVDQKKEYEDL